MAISTLNTRIVTRHDTASNWTSANPVLLNGEIGIESNTNKMKFGDGVTAWNSLAYAGADETQINNLIAAADDNFYVVVKTSSETDAQAMTRVCPSPSKGDICVVRYEFTTGKYTYTGYVYDGSAWGAMDGNYDAENVYFKEDITVTTKVGTIQTLTNGSATWNTAGKNVKQALTSLLAQEKNPSKPTPTCTVTLTDAGEKEVGESFTPNYTTTFSGKTYDYGPATGVTATGWSVWVTGTSTNKKTTATGSFTAFNVGDDTNYSLQATATYGDGAIPKTNLGNDYPASQIKAGTTATATSASVTGYRKMFYGSKVTPVSLTSANIRALTGVKAEATTFEMSVAEGAKQVIIAIPSARTLTSVEDLGAFGTAITASFISNNVNVNGANNYTAAAYKAYVYTPDTALGSNTYRVTIS